MCLVALAVVSTLLVVVLIANMRMRKQLDQEQQEQHDLHLLIGELKIELQEERSRRRAEADRHVPTAGEQFMAKLQDVMDKHLENNTLSVNDLVDEMGMGRTVFFNRLKSMTGLSPVEYIRDQRVLRAKQLMDSTQYNLTEITYMVGMNDSRYFSKCFKAKYGVTPTEYRKIKNAKKA